MSATTPLKRPPPATRQWGLTDEELARRPHAFRDDLLAGKVCLVSGGGSGLGRAMAFLLTRLGADVMICGRREDRLAETAESIRTNLGRDIGYRAMTIRDPEQVNALIDETVQRYGKLDLQVNNGGGQFPQPAIDYSVKGWNAVIDTNLNGTWWMMQAAAKAWRDQKHRGSIVNIVANVWRGMPQVAHTCAARAGVIYLSKSVAIEWAPLGIRVNCISPGSIATEGLNVYPPEAAARFGNANPLRQYGDAFDIAQSVVHVGADITGKFITGETLVVDGGNQMWGDVWPGGIPDWFKVADR